MAHTGEKTCFTAEVFVVHKGRVLLRRHRKFNSIWLSVGGHIEQGEDPNQGAIREVKEEVGLDISLYDGFQRFYINEEKFHDLVPPVALARHAIENGPDHLILVYFATSESDTVVPEKPDDEWVWATKEDLGTMDLVPNVRAYATAALEALGG